MKIALLIASILALSYTLTAPPVSQNLNSEAARKCKAQNQDNQYLPEGMFGKYRCVRIFKDKRKPCKSSSECEGGCIFIAADIYRTFCKINDSKYGCWATIEDHNQGKPIICRL